MKCSAAEQHAVAADDGLDPRGDGASVVEGYTRRVKRWRGGGMIQRWVASALVEAEPRFRRVRGYRDLRNLVAALDALAPPDGAVADVA